MLVNVRVPRAWMKPNNALIASVANDYPNVTVADWAKASKDHRDYMVKDGVHLTGKGAVVYTTRHRRGGWRPAHLRSCPAIWPPVGHPGTLVSVVMLPRWREARVAE